MSEISNLFHGHMSGSVFSVDLKLDPQPKIANYFNTVVEVYSKSALCYNVSQQILYQC